MQHTKRVRWIGICFLAFCAGCRAPNAQLTTCQTEKEQLLTTIRGQRDTTRALNQQVASLENRLDQAEKELARGGTGTRISSRPNESPPMLAPSQSASPPTIKSESLPWRSPGGKAESATPQSNNRRTSSTSSSASRTSLVSLARRDSRVQYDPKSQSARVDVPIAFSDKSATLTADDKLKLDELAKLLKTPEARELHVMVAGPAATRAQAVTDYLDRHGIAEERLAVSASRPGAAASGSGVEVFLLQPDATVVGWEPPPTVRR